MSTVESLWPQNIAYHVRRDNVADVRELIALGMDLDAIVEHRSSALHLAVDAQNIAMCRLLVEAGANVNLQVDLPGKPFRSFSPLHYAARKGYVEIASVLLSAGADVNLRGPSGVTALHLAIEAGQERGNWIETANTLLEAGADVTLVADAFYSNHAIGIVLVNDRPVSNHFLTPLHHLLHTSTAFVTAQEAEGGCDLLGRLLAHGAEPCVIPPGAQLAKYYLTPLQQAVKCAPPACVRVLLDSPLADISQRTVGGKSLNQLATRADIKQLLLAKRTELEVGGAIGVAEAGSRRQRDPGPM